MLLVRCVSERKSIPGQLIVGKKYWIDTSTTWTDCSGDEYARVYLDEDKLNEVGTMSTRHFKPIFRYLNYGGSPSTYINSRFGFLLKDIINWCLNNQHDQLSDKLILYIQENKLDIPENMEKEFTINHMSFKEYVSRDMEEEYEKYLGYSLQCID